MANGKCEYQVAKDERELTKFRFGGPNEEGTYELYDDKIQLYKKSKVVAGMFGAIGSMVEGKGKPDFELRADMISSYHEVGKGRFKFNLKDGRLGVFNLIGFGTNDARQQLIGFFDRAIARPIIPPKADTTQSSSIPSIPTAVSAPPVTIPTIPTTVSPAPGTIPVPPVSKTEKPKEKAWIISIGSHTAAVANCIEYHTGLKSSEISDILTRVSKYPVSVMVSNAALFVQDMNDIGAEVRSSITVQSKPVSVKSFEVPKHIPVGTEAPVAASAATSSQDTPSSKSPDSKPSDQQKTALPVMVKCRSCGTETYKGAYCIHCGKPLINRCPKCLTELPDQAKFCFECGSPVQ